MAKIPICENILNQSTAILSVEKSAIGFGAASTYNAENFRSVGPARYTVAAIHEIYKCSDYQMPEFNFAEIEEHLWSVDYSEYRKISGSEEVLLEKSTKNGKEICIKDYFSTVTIHNNPSFYETMDPDGVPFVQLGDPFFAISFILPISRWQMVDFFLKVQQGNQAFVLSPLNSIFLADKLSMKFNEEEKITIDGEAYSCKEWQISMNGPQIKIIS